MRPFYQTKTDSSVCRHRGTCDRPLTITANDATARTYAKLISAAILTTIIIVVKIDRTGYAIGGIFFTMGLQRSILKGHIKRNVTQQPTQLSYHTTYLFLCVRDIVAYVLLFSPAIYSGLNNLFGRDRFCCTCYFSCVSNYQYLVNF